jgi:DNA-binding beta-propeller fold protein YncE
MTIHFVNTLGRAMLCAGLLMLSVGAHATRVPLVLSQCSLAESGAASPSGITFNTSTAKFAVTDDSDDLVYLLNADCSVDSTFSTSVLGSNSPQGIAYDPVNDGYAIVDNSADEVFFADAAGDFVGRCDTAAIGATGPSGITYRSDSNLFVLVDSTADQAYVIDRSVLSGEACNVIDEFDTGVFGSNAPVGLTFVPGTGQFVEVDSGVDEVFILSNTFLLQDQFDTSAGFGSSSPEGIVYLPGTGTYYTIDSGTDLLTELDAEGTSALFCSTAAVGANSVVDIAVKPGSGEIAVVDSAVDTVYILDDSTCALVRTFGIGGAEINAPAGMAYLPTTDQLVIADTSDDALYFVGYTSTLLEDQCDVGGLGLEVINGVDYIPGLERLVLTDAGNDATVVTDLDCNVIQQASLAFFGNRTGDAVTSSAVAYQSGLGRYMVVDSSDDQVYLQTVEGLIERDFDLLSLGIDTSTGVTALPDGETWLFTDSSDDAIYRLVLPALKDAQSISGTFTSTGLGLTSVLYDRGEGRLSGALLLPSGAIPLFGQYTEQAARISFGIELPNGNPLVFSGTVSADLNTITLPPPLGALIRTF